MKRSTQECDLSGSRGFLKREAALVVCFLYHQTDKEWGIRYVTSPYFTFFAARAFAINSTRNAFSSSGVNLGLGFLFYRDRLFCLFRFSHCTDKALLLAQHLL
jgi:hypothetical protein